MSIVLCLFKADLLLMLFIVEAELKQAFPLV